MYYNIEDSIFSKKYFGLGKRLPFFLVNPFSKAFLNIKTGPFRPGLSKIILIVDFQNVEIIVNLGDALSLKEFWSARIQIGDEMLAMKIIAPLDGVHRIQTV